MNRRAILPRILKVLFSLSLLFVILYLIEQDWLEVPVVHSLFYLIISILLLLIGFMVDAKAWMEMINVKISSISYRDAIVSSGKYVFAKYIPGKFWIILGKAGYLKEKYGTSLITLSSYSIVYQILAIIAAILISVGVISIFNRVLFYILLTITVLAIFILFFLQQFSFKTLSSIFSWLLKREIIIPVLSNKILFKTFFLSIINWLIWSLAFFLFIKAISIPETVLSFNIGLIFPISIVIGIIVLFAPGGLGIREGFLFIGLTALGMSTKEVTTIAFISRFWFLIGELFFFLMAILLERHLLWGRK